MQHLLPQIAAVDITHFAQHFADSVDKILGGIRLDIRRQAAHAQQTFAGAGSIHTQSQEFIPVLLNQRNIIGSHIYIQRHQKLLRWNLLMRSHELVIKNALMGSMLINKIKRCFALGNNKRFINLTNRPDSIHTAVGIGKSNSFPVSRRCSLRRLRLGKFTARLMHLQHRLLIALAVGNSCGGLSKIIKRLPHCLLLSLLLFHNRSRLLRHQQTFGSRCRLHIFLALRCFENRLRAAFEHRLRRLIRRLRLRCRCNRHRNSLRLRLHKHIQLRIRQQCYLRLLGAHRLRQRIGQRLIHSLINQTVITEFDFTLLRMHVNINTGCINCYIDNSKGKAAFGNLRLVSMVHSLGKHFAADAASVDKERLPLACSLQQRRLADKAANSYLRIVQRYLQKVFGNILAVQRFNRMLQITVTGSAEHLFIIIHQLKAHIRTRKRQPCQKLADITSLCAYGFQKFTACRYVKEQILHNYGSTRTAAACRNLRVFAAVDMYGGSEFLALRTG